MAVISETLWMLRAGRYELGGRAPPPPVRRLHVLTGFLRQSKDIEVRLTADSELPVGVRASVTGCLSLCQPCDRSVKGEAILSLSVSWDWLHSPVTPGWMDAFIHSMGGYGELIEYMAATNDYFDIQFIC